MMARSAGSMSNAFIRQVGEYYSTFLAIYQDTIN